MIFNKRDLFVFTLLELISIDIVITDCGKPAIYRDLRISPDLQSWPENTKLDYFCDEEIVKSLYPSTRWCLNGKWGIIPKCGKLNLVQKES